MLNRFLFDAAYAVTNYSRTQDYASDALRMERGTPEWFAQAGHESDHRAVLEGNGPARRPARHLSHPPFRRQQHDVRDRLPHRQGGGAVSQPADTAKPPPSTETSLQQYRNGVPDSVRVYNTPTTFFNSVSSEQSLRAGCLDDQALDHQRRAPCRPAGVTGG